MCFPVNFRDVLRTPFLQNSYGFLFLHFWSRNDERIIGSAGPTIFDAVF